MKRRDAPLIVFGAPRSGTTYVEQILNHHPDILVTHEARIFAWLHQSLKLNTVDDMLVLTGRQEFVKYLKSHLPDVVRGYYKSMAPKAMFWGDKNPHYVYLSGCLDTILELFPSSLFLHVIRDGRDVVASLVRKRTAKGVPWTDFAGAHRVWSVAVDVGTRFGATVPLGQYIEMRYEKLVADDAAEARRVFDELGIPWDAGVEAFCRAQSECRTPFKDPTRDLALGPTGSDWRTIFTAEEQLRSLELLGRILVSLGYESEQSLARAVAETGDAPAKKAYGATGRIAS